MDFYEVVDKVVDLLKQRGRVTHSALKRQFEMDDNFLEDLKNEILYAHPVIDDDGFTLWESNSIVRYLAMKYAPDMMYGGNIETFALASRWMDWENNELLHGQHTLVMQLIRLPENQRDPSEVEAARQDLIPKFQMIDEQLGRTRFIAGERFTMGDIPLGIRTHRWHLFDVERPPMANLTRWYSEIREQRGFKAWIEDPANHLSG